MKTQITITETVDGIAIGSPFNSTNNEMFRSRGGKFDRTSGRWIFPRTSQTIDLIDEMFGTESPLVTVRVPKDQIVEDENQWKIGGYILANRRNRDSSVEIPLGVQVEKGRWAASGGSVANPRVKGDDDLVITVVMRRSFAELHMLEIIATHDTPLINPLEAYTTKDLLEELARRGVSQ